MHLKYKAVKLLALGKKIMMTILLFAYKEQY